MATTMGLHAGVWRVRCDTCGDIGFALETADDMAQAIIDAHEQQHDAEIIAEARAERRREHALDARMEADEGRWGDDD